jgi:glyoxylase-like metal-dependent hydrolase (beta-lactamase superfamily II)
MLTGNYRWYEPYGFGPAPEDVAFLERELGGDAPVDLGLRGGETIRLGAGRRLEVLHLPGHTLGHIGLWDPQHRVALVIDAVLFDGVYDRAGHRLIPPRYYDAEAYRTTIRRVRALEPELLLTSHYAPMGADAARAFCDRSLAYVDEVEAIVAQERAAGRTGLRELTELVDGRLGPFPEFTTEIAAGVRSHLAAVA